MTRIPAFLLLLALAACGGGRSEDGTDLGTGDAVKGEGQVEVGTPGAGTATTNSPRADEVAAGMADGDRESAGGDVEMANTTLVGDVDQVVNHRGALTSLAPSVAVPLIRRIAERLDASNDEQLGEIADDLNDLRGKLEETGSDGKEIGEILNRLSEKVARYANAGSAQAQQARPRLARLAGSLSAAGKQLAGPEAGKEGGNGQR